jgi:fumarate hydratase subunit beta
MTDIRKIITPLDNEAVVSLRAGDKVLLSGTIYSARDQAHKLICSAMEKGERPPFDLAGAVIYFVGPSPARQGKVIGAAGPTTSSRMDAFSPALIKAGLKAMIGKGYRSDEVRQALVESKAVHFAAIGGAGALLGKCVKASEIIAYDHLGTEAVRKLVVEDMPLTVAYDSFGKSVYNEQGITS